MTNITTFNGRYRFLSNFWPCDIWHNGMMFPSVEHAYQAAKSVRHQDRRYIQAAGTAGIAKRRGTQITLREDWMEVRTAVMAELVALKFRRGSKLAESLLQTHPYHLSEGNYWGDEFWGVNLRNNKGENMLGRILMAVRDQLREGVA